MIMCLELSGDNNTTPHHITLYFLAPMAMEDAGGSDDMILEARLLLSATPARDHLHTFIGDNLAIGKRDTLKLTFFNGKVTSYACVNDICLIAACMPCPMEFPAGTTEATVCVNARDFANAIKLIPSSAKVTLKVFQTNGLEGVSLRVSDSLYVCASSVDATGMFEPEWALRLIAYDTIESVAPWSPSFEMLISDGRVGRWLTTASTGGSKPKAGGASATSRVMLELRGEADDSRIKTLTLSVKDDFSSSKVMVGISPVPDVGSSPSDTPNAAFAGSDKWSVLYKSFFSMNIFASIMTHAGTQGVKLSLAHELPLTAKIEHGCPDFHVAYSLMPMHEDV